MRFHARTALSLLLLGFAASPAALGQARWAPENSGQDAPGARRAARDTRKSSQDPTAESLSTQSLNTDERLAILGAALDFRRHAVHPADCSHFIHALYERAGFPYEYASSSDLYMGTDEFRRVATPLPGDLVVWLGHAGIVTNPAHHAMISLLTSGPGVDSYDSPYWKRRGHPRFFRYVKTNVRSLRSANNF